MKKDLLFIILVIIGGFAGLVYTNQKSTDELVKKKGDYSEYSENERSAANSYKANKQKSGPSEIGVSIPSISSGQEHYNIQTIDIDSELNKIDLDTTSSKIDEMLVDDWNKRFDFWKAVLLDSMTKLTKLIDAKSVADCLVVFEYSDEQIEVDFSQKVLFEVEEHELAFSNEGLDNLVELTFLKDGIRLRVASKKLTDFCTTP